MHTYQHMKRAYVSLFVMETIRSRISKSSSTHPRGGGRAGDGGFSRDPRCRLICLAAPFSRNWIPPVSDLSACSEEDRAARGRHPGPPADPDCTRPDKCAPIRHQRRPCSGPDCANARSPASSFAVSTSSPAGLRSASPCSSTSLDFASLRPLRFIVDFYCPSLQLAVEVDGPIHRYRRRQDEQRTRILAPTHRSGRRLALLAEVHVGPRARSDASPAARIENYGVKIIRFASEDILDDVDQVIRAIRSALPERQSPCCLG